MRRRCSRRPAVALVCLLLGCAAQRKPADYSTFYSRVPRSIVVAPVVDESGKPDAAVAVMSSITIPFAERGYYVFPVEVTGRLLREAGLADPEAARAVPPARFLDLFGADAVLYVTIREWREYYLLFAASLAVELHYTLRDTRSGEILWQRERRVTVDSLPLGGAPGGDPFTGVIVIAASTLGAAATSLSTDPEDLARRANAQVTTKEGIGLPAGPYHPEHAKDRKTFP